MSKTQRALVGWAIVLSLAASSLGALAVSVLVLYKISNIVPAPVPPEPDGPGPLPPSDPLTNDLQRLYSADTSKDKAVYKSRLVRLYRTAAEAAIKDQSVTTTGELYNKLRNAAPKWPFELPDDALKTVRERLATDYKQVLGTKDHPLSSSDREEADKLFGRFAAALSAVK